MKNKDFMDINNKFLFWGHLHTHFGVKVKREHVVVFKIGPQTAIVMVGSRLKLSVDMAVGEPIFMIDYPIGVSKTEIIFISE